MTEETEETDHKPTSLSHEYKSKYDDSISSASTIETNMCTHIKKYIDNLDVNNCSKEDRAFKMVFHYIEGLKSDQENTSIVHGCKYLYHWMYENLSKIKKYRTDVFAFYKKLLKAACDMLELTEIYNHQINNLSEEVFLKHKPLANMYEHYNKLSSQNSCADATDFVQLYSDQINKCQGVVSDDFCNELEKFKKDYESIIQTKNCPGVENTLPSEPKYSSSSTILTVSSTILTPLILFITYKFTPFGSIIRSRIRKTKQTLHDVDKGGNTITHTYERSNRNPGNMPFNMAYHSV
ncbi:PIR protein [Plasmodium vivax]|uniref:VIR protein n=1 Tax=Plasmodium vivax TaxID=5855 RepID=A0A564ZYH4_PLAVI|nr:PIR protein [Plasmodium vivax]